MSAIPEAIDKIVAFMGTVGPTVYDGPPTPGVWPTEDYIIVGWNRDDVGIDVVIDPAAFVALDQEQFSVSCMISAISGDNDVRARRTTAFGYYQTVATKIRQDKTLGGAVAHARLSTAAATQISNTNGTAVEITFDITCTAYI